MIFIKMIFKFLWKMFRPLIEYTILGILVISPIVGTILAIISVAGIAGIAEEKMPFGISPVVSLILSILYATSLLWLTKAIESWKEIKQSYHDDQRDKISRIMSDKRRQRDTLEAEQAKALQFAANIRKGSAK